MGCSHIWPLLGDIGSLASGFCAVLAIPFLWRQLLHARKSLDHIEKSRIADLQPYISVQVERGSLRNEPGVLLRIANHGRTPALKVSIDFEPGRVWQFVSPANFAFVQPNGISVLAPGESKVYFLGRSGVDEDFDRLNRDEIQVMVSWESHVSTDRSRQNTAISLADGRFSVA